MVEPTSKHRKASSDGAAPEGWLGFCSGLLRDESKNYLTVNDGSAQGFVEFVQWHGVECLLLEKLAFAQNLPEDVARKLKELAVARAMWELRLRAQLSVLAEALSLAGVKFLVFKGVALAYSLYKNPVWRTRSDTDLLIQPEDLAITLNALKQLDYQASANSDEVIFYQQSFWLNSKDGGAQHQLDLHWQLNNSEVLKLLFPLTQLYPRAVKLHSLSGKLLGVTGVDALLIACFHRAVHHHAEYVSGDIALVSGDRLIWLYDIHLLASAFAEVDWQDFFQLAKQKGIAEICRQGLTSSQACLATPLPHAWQDCLISAELGVADYYLLKASKWGRLWLDWRACEGMQKKIDFMRVVAFPSAPYMKRKYAGDKITWLPWLYLKRFLSFLVRRKAPAVLGG